jgi:hypothetical protein
MKSSNHGVVGGVAVFERADCPNKLTVDEVVKMFHSDHCIG